MFEINLKISSLKGVFDPEDINISEAISSIFDVSDYIEFNWNNILIKLTCKYDVSEIWDDLIEMLNLIKYRKSKKFIIYWPSSTFFATWDFNIDHNNINIKSYWTSINGGVEQLKRIKSVSDNINIDFNKFLFEWSKIIRIVKERLELHGYQSIIDFKEFDILSN